MIKNKNILYENRDHLIDVLKTIHLRKPNRALVQVFCGVMNLELIQGIIDIFNEYLPGTPLIGVTTEDGIMNGTLKEHKTIINITSFQKTTVKSVLIEDNRDPQVSGKEIAEALSGDHTKSAIIFACGIREGGLVEDALLMRSIQDHLPNVTISGGQAVDNCECERSYVFTEKGLTSQGIVGASLSSETLTIMRLRNLNWTPIGKMMTITDVNGFQVNSIDGQLPRQLYKNFLGRHVIENKSVVKEEFPLLVRRACCYHIIHVKTLNEDGSISYDHPLEKGDQVQFGYCHVGLFPDGVDDTFNSLDGKEMAVAYVYSSIERKERLGAYMERELAPLKGVHCSAGFLSHGQYCQDKTGENVFLRNALTVLALSEGFAFDDEGAHENSFGKEVSRKYIIMRGLQNIIDYSS